MSSSRSVNFFKVLNVSRDATNKQVKDAYFKLAQAYHPDKNPAPDASERFKLINEAYNTLKDESSRRLYESSLGGTRSNGYRTTNTQSRQQYQYRRPHRYQKGHSYASSTGGIQHQPVNDSILMVLVLFGIGGFVLSVSMMTNTTRRAPHSVFQENVVEAWFNPNSKRWETPAPWDPLYIANKSSMKRIHRNIVHRRNPSS
mmetsp:Transcript_15794/g.23747  ORF Transcript_15794/g.23747 Transcript_15794/m.23747 type:complete len:201 (-) Transcript_15794:175-777(-)|eukprot:CAMPEP_0185017976 /NCGR_PEP_ID=MMETSP1103-20130426/829_1 /TAXON_ID=36769 /ORGANISM="Paraphysomonas bandaiensis, Strain Caron Lab Isolate" /LENGTH=200 /DNA_ID=CAMNT_0027547607 /DNA_START=97 /DNA_END=699 /DNA_ORIENTATION=-